MNFKEIAKKMESRDGKIEVAVRFWDEAGNEIREFLFQDPSSKEIEAVIGAACEQEQKIELHAVQTVGGEPDYEALDVVYSSVYNGDIEAAAVEIQNIFEEFYEEIAAAKA